jgi:hypothetical protein
LALFGGEQRVVFGDGRRLEAAVDAARTRRNNSGSRVLASHRLEHRESATGVDVEIVQRRFEAVEVVTCPGNVKNEVLVPDRVANDTFVEDVGDPDIDAA